MTSGYFFIKLKQVHGSTSWMSLIFHSSFMTLDSSTEFTRSTGINPAFMRIFILFLSTKIVNTCYYFPHLQTMSQSSCFKTFRSHSPFLSFRMITNRIWIQTNSVKSDLLLRVKVREIYDVGTGQETIHT